MPKFQVQFCDAAEASGVLLDVHDFFPVEAEGSYEAVMRALELRPGSIPPLPRKLFVFVAPEGPIVNIADCDLRAGQKPTILHAYHVDIVRD